MKRTAAPTPAEPVEDSTIIERPDGFYWRDEETGEEFGPFPTLADAIADRDTPADDTIFEPGETVEEAEQELGIAEWVDPDTGQPAEDTLHRYND